MLDRLLEDHRRIIVLADRLEGELGERCPHDLAMVAQARWALARELLQHLAFEDSVLPSGPESGVAAPAASSPARFQQTVKAYLARWNGDAVVTGWQDFRVETMKLLQALRGRIRHEERHVYPRMTFANAGRTGYREAVASS